MNHDQWWVDSDHLSQFKKRTGELTHQDDISQLNWLGWSESTAINWLRIYVGDFLAETKIFRGEFTSCWCGGFPKWGYPKKWMVSFMENPRNGWELGVPPILGNLHVLVIMGQQRKAGYVANRINPDGVRSFEGCSPDPSWGTST